MKVTLEQIKNSHEAVKKLLNTELPVRAAFRLSNLAKATVDLIERIEETRMELVKKYGKEDAKGNFNVEAEKVEEFYKEFNEFLQEEVTLTLEPLNIDLIEGVKLTTIELISLEPFMATG